MTYRECFKEQLYKYGLVVFGGVVGAAIGLCMDPQTKLSINNINDFALFSIIFVIFGSCMRFVYKNTLKKLIYCKKSTHRNDECCRKL